MTYDIGGYGTLILLGFALGFGAISQVVAGRDANRWIWLAGAVGWIVGGVVASEGLVGTMTADEIQPIVDGLAFDEALLGGLVGGLVAVVLTRIVTRAPRSIAGAHPSAG